MPALEMLWELDDPEQVLREPFGHADTAAVEAWVGRVLTERWGSRSRRARAS